MKDKNYFENLDGLRFLCFLSVFFFHSFHTEYDYISNSQVYNFVSKDIFGNGNLGVNFFFVLSGFLITYLLIQEKKENGQINLKKFWMRRILRIWPLYYFAVLFGFVAFPLLKFLFGQTPDETATPLYYILFINNFDFIKNGTDASILSVLWSVAIEEQFYFIWPIILFVLPINKYWIAFSIVIISSLVFRALNNTFILHEYHTLSCIGDMAIGAMGAWLIISNAKFKKAITYLKKYHIGIIYLTFFGAFLFRDELLFVNHTIRIFERVFIACLIILIILEQSYAKNSLFKISNLKTISKLGVITYGLYCLHFIGILTTTTITNKLGFNTNLWQVLIIDTTLALAITIIISKVSFKFYETPFLKFKEKFAYRNNTK